MSDYNFLNLSSLEFENLSRDLLQKHLDITFESYTSGRDNGIDLQHIDSNGNRIIVQCKRYNDYRSLLSNLRKEITKVKKLNPKKYIITTSVGLTPNQKNKIFEIFSPFLDSTGDIYGKDDLNNLINIHPEVEKQNFKLWLSSINILDKITKSKILNQSTFEKDKVAETINLYVNNESYFESLNILKEKKYVIISGIPGVGKTTLARILVYHFLGKGFNEFIFLSDSINEGYELFKDGVKQIFLFDDFLGSNFLENRLSTNEDQRIARFIEKINRSQDKILILTTREYILTQAKQRHEALHKPFLDLAKCVIDLSKYTNIVKAKIFYNHLYFSNIHKPYINNILEKNNYKKIIEHKNYNPRIIKTVTSEEVWKNITPKYFTTKILEFLDNPVEVWKHAFETHISKFSQCILANLMSSGTPILYDDLKNIVQKFSSNYTTKYGFIYSDLEFKKSIQELENTFIITKADQIGQIAVEYQNPSIQDFLINFFKDLTDYINDIINSSVFFNQLFNIFSFNEMSWSRRNSSLTSVKILLNEDLKENFINTLINNYLIFKNFHIQLNRNLRQTPIVKWTKIYQSQYSIIHTIIREIPIENYSNLKVFLSDQFEKILYPSNLSFNDYNYYIILIRAFQDSLTYDSNKILTLCYNCINALDQVNDFIILEDVFPNEFVKFIKATEEFEEKIVEFMIEEAENADDDLLEITLEDIESIGNKLDIDYYEARSILERKINNKFDIYEENEENFLFPSSDRYKDSSSNEDDIIKDIFNSLRNK